MAHHHTIFGVAKGGRRGSIINFDDAILPLNREDSYQFHHHVEASNEDLLEPGIYCKSPRITVVKEKKDALTKLNVHQLKEYMHARAKTHDKRPVWVDVQGADEDTMQAISDIFGLHPLTLEDCTVPDTLEKIENRTSYIFMVFNDFSLHHAADEKETKDKTATGNSKTAVNLCILIFHDIILTIHAKPVHSIYTVVPKLEYCPETHIPSLEFVLYIILVRMLDYCDAYINKLDKEAETLDQQVLLISRTNYKQHTSEILSKIGSTTKQTAEMLVGLVNKREVFAVLQRQDIFSSNGIRYIKSANDHLLKLHLKLNLVRDTLNDINTLYMSKLSVEMSLLSNEVGIHMRRFGVIGTIFLPLNLLAGIFGMNVLLPGEAHQTAHYEVPHPFITIMLFMIGIAAAQIVVFYYLKWL